MPELSGLIGAAGPIAALLAPVVALLFVALRLRKRLPYPHELLSPRDDSKPMAVLFRSLRLYYDAAIDAACAVIVGLALTGYPQPESRRGPATILDCSLSMLSGMRGDRPLDEAARLILSDDTLRSSTLFALGWDPVKREHRLVDLTELMESIESPQELALALESSEAFLSADFSLVPKLTRRGYGDLTLITDDGAIKGTGVKLRTLSTKPPNYILPASAIWDEDQQRGVVRFVAAGGAAITALWELAGDGSLSRAKPEDYTIVPGPSGFELSFAEAGLWAVQWEGRILPFEAPGRPAPLSAKGAFASRLVAVLGPIGVAAGAETASNDYQNRRTGLSDDGVIVRDGGGANTRGVLSVSTVKTEPAVLPPRLTLGAIVAAGIDRRADLPLGSAALSSPEAAIPFWVARAARVPAAKSESGPRGRPIRVGDGFLYPARPGRRASLDLPPAEEYAPRGRGIIVTAGAAPEGRLIVALLLATLYGLKLALARKFRGSTTRGSWRPGTSPRNPA
ncbi:MAG: hypothetical protein A2Y38_07345 [Spirochaetes bacterium GWB1_59_5]|nr:MAG: hypothetical protein A2Y38_07345 [Spirochaetes bacterium GWB1_59_5]